MTKTKRLPPALRGEQLLETALKVATQHGLAYTTREMVATAAGVSAGLITARLGQVKEMRKRIMRAAVHRSILPLVAEGLAMRDKYALAAPEPLRLAAAASLNNADGVC
jgi:AcrR family transcriptional regulator